MKIHPAVFVFSLIATLLAGYLIATEVHNRRSAKQAWKEFVEIAKEEFPQYMSGEKASPQEQAKDFLDAVVEGVKEFGAAEDESVHKAYNRTPRNLMRSWLRPGVILMAKCLFSMRPTKESLITSLKIRNCFATSRRSSDKTTIDSTNTIGQETTKSPAVLNCWAFFV